MRKNSGFATLMNIDRGCQADVLTVNETKENINFLNTI
jgi:hypothetical protein